jgi:hypothetical protein
MKSRKPGTFFPWPDEPEGSKNGVVLRLLDYVTVQKMKKVKGKPEFTSIGTDFCIVSWTGITDDAGNDFPCTTENKLYLVQNNPEAAVFIKKCLDKLQDERDEAIKSMDSSKSFKYPKGSA